MGSHIDTATIETVRGRVVPALDDTGDARGRRIAFRALAVLLALLVLAMGAFSLAFVGLMWVPESTLVDMFGEEPGYIAVHRSHFMAGGLASFAIVLSMLVQLRRPSRRTASMLLLTVLAVTSLVVYGFHGTLAVWLLEEWLWVLPVLVLGVFLHPARRQLWRRPAVDVTRLRIALVGAVPWAVFGLGMARLQLVTTGPHAVEEHWGWSAVLAAAVAAGAVIGSTEHPGWRLPAWIAAVASVVFGAHSLVYPGLASGLSTPWALAAVAWGAIFAAAIVRRSRGSVGRPPRVDGTQAAPSSSQGRGG